MAVRKPYEARRVSVKNKLTLGVQMPDIVIGILQDNARNKLEAAGISDFTDSSTGTPGAALTTLAVPSAAFDGAVTGASPAAAFNTAMGVIENAFAVVADNLNNSLARLGLPQVRFAAGLVATAATIPAMTKSLTATSGATAIDYATGRSAMVVAKNNFATLVRAANSLASALGEATLRDASGGAPDLGQVGFLNLEDIPTALAGTGSPVGTTSISDTVVDAFLLALADDVATLADYVNNWLGAVSTTGVTDSTGGTATLVIPAIPTPAAAVGAATTSAPKAGFDTVVAVIENNSAELGAVLNRLARRHSLAQLTDATGQTVNGTLESQSVALTAVDGSTGTDALDQVSGRAIMGSVRDTIVTLASKANELAPYYGELVINTDALVAGGAVVGTTIDNEPASGTGVGGATAVTVLDADVDAWLVLVRNAFASIAARVNAMIGANVATKPLKVVAAA